MLSQQVRVQLSSVWLGVGVRTSRPLLVLELLYEAADVDRTDRKADGLVATTDGRRG